MAAVNAVDEFGPLTLDAFGNEFGTYDFPDVGSEVELTLWKFTPTTGWDIASVQNVLWTQYYTTLNGYTGFQEVSVLSDDQTTTGSEFLLTQDNLYFWEFIAFQDAATLTAWGSGNGLPSVVESLIGDVQTYSGNLYDLWYTASSDASANGWFYRMKLRSYASAGAASTGIDSWVTFASTHFPTATGIVGYQVFPVDGVSAAATTSPNVGGSSLVGTSYITQTFWADPVSRDSAPSFSDGATIIWTVDGYVRFDASAISALPSLSNGVVDVTGTSQGDNAETIININFNEDD